MSAILSWISSNLSLLSAATAVLLFVIYDRRKKRLEIEKLQLEVGKLKQESLIYRPDLKEMGDVLAALKGRHYLLGAGAVTPVDRLLDRLEEFLTRLLAYYGYHDAFLFTALTERLHDQHAPEPGKELPDVGELMELWGELGGSVGLPQELWESLDRFIARYAEAKKSARTAGTTTSLAG